MLTQLTIHNFILVDDISLEWQPGMTVITGETGAGKSILMQALRLTLGERSTTSWVRPGAKRAEVITVFDLSTNTQARQWLQELNLDDGNDCILRRTINQDGGSRAWINAVPSALKQLQELSEMLIDIQGQHQHQSLLIPGVQLRLLDDYSRHKQLLEELAVAWRQWQQYQTKLDLAIVKADSNREQLGLLRYQLQEFDQLNLQEGELEKLEQQQKLLSNATQVLEACQNAQMLLRESEHQSLELLLQQIQTLFSDLQERTKSMEAAQTLLQQVSVDIDEAVSLVRDAIDEVEVNPSLLNEVEERITAIFTLARKHQVIPSELQELSNQLRQQLEALKDSQTSQDNLQRQAEHWRSNYLELAQNISQSRAQNATKLGQEINNNLTQLSMEGAEFSIQLTSKSLEQAGSKGMDFIEFIIKTNRGQSYQPIRKIASGGELSRISLAISVITAQTSPLITMVFDEVDAGVGGTTANTIGTFLKDLSQYGQVICITHSPQIASKGNQQFCVSKEAVKELTEIRIELLDSEQRIEELARMSGGAVTPEQARQFAKNMLQP